MQTLYPPNDEGTAPGDGDAVLSQELKNNFDAVRSLLTSNQTHEAQAMATKTAVQATEELTRLENGIAELEALLAQQEEEELYQNVPQVAFPSLPPIVIEEEGEEQAPSSNTNTGKQGKLVHR